MNNKKRVILIDLDGVLSQYNGNFDPDYIPPVRSGVKKFIKEISKDYTLKLFTSRNLLTASQWLAENNLTKYFADITNVKVPCYLILDDRCVCFDGNYQKAFDNINNYKPWFRT